MNKLTVNNESGSKYNFFIEDYSVMLEATTVKGNVHLFKVKGIEDGKIDVGTAKLPMTDMSQEIISFISTAKTRTLVEFKNKEEAMKFERENENSGSAFVRNNIYYAYAYNN